MMSTLVRHSTIEIGGSIEFSSYQSKLREAYGPLRRSLALGTANYIQRLIESRPEMSIAEIHNGIVYTHRWGNGEIKSLLSPYTPFSKEDYYWAGHYPFIKKSQAIKSIGGRSFDTYSIVTDDLHDIRYFRLPDECSATLISHVNHYGHFALDSLPLHHALHKYLGLSKIYGLDPGLNKAIINDYNSIMRKISPNHYVGYSPVMPTAFRINRAIAAYASSPLASIYLLRQVRDKILLSPYLSYSLKTLTEKMPSVFGSCRRRLFVTRGRSTASRICNYHEILRILIARGFCPVDITSCTIEEMVALFQGSEVIVSECGTASHLSASFSGDDTKIYSLVPKRLLREATNSSLFGCLSYYCGYLHKLTFVVGDSVNTCSSPTSDSAYYDARYVAEVISIDR